MTDHGLRYAMPVLAGDLIRLEPLRAERAPGGAPEIFRWQRPADGALAVKNGLLDRLEGVA